MMMMIPTVVTVACVWLSHGIWMGSLKTGSFAREVTISKGVMGSSESSPGAPTLLVLATKNDWLAFESQSYPCFQVGQQYSKIASNERTCPVSKARVIWNTALHQCHVILTMVAGSMSYFLFVSFWKAIFNLRCFFVRYPVRTSNSGSAASIRF